MKAVFPLAGLGSRMLPITKSVPKELLPVIDKPLIHYTVEEALASGITDLVFVVRDQKNAIKNYFDSSCTTIDANSAHHRMNKLDSIISKIRSISYIKQKKPLGLGHAILCTKKIIGNEPFAVLLPDDLIKARTPVTYQMIQHFKRLGSSIVAISKVQNKDISKYGIVKASPPDCYGITRVLGMIEKPLLAEAPSNLGVVGRYILTPDIFQLLGHQNREGNECEIDLTVAMTKLLKKQMIYGYSYKGTRFDCGSIAGLQIANMALAMNKAELKHDLMTFFRELN